MTYTVWTYDHDAAPHHDNELKADTVDDLKQAIRLARQRVAETNHNTGFANIVDNGIAGRMGDCGVVVVVSKTKGNVVRRQNLREQYRKLLWREKYTNSGLRALYNPELRVWEYYEFVGPGGADLRQTGSTRHYQA